VTFRFGAYQLTLPVDHIAYARFERIFIVFIALIFGSLALGQAGSFETGVAKAKRSARRLFAIMDRHPVIDNYSEDGLKPVREKDLYTLAMYVYMHDNIHSELPTHCDSIEAVHMHAGYMQLELLILLGECESPH